MPMLLASRANSSPPGRSTRHISSTIRPKCAVVRGKVQHGAADHRVQRGVRERQRIHLRHRKFSGGSRGASCAAIRRTRSTARRVAVHRVDVEAGAQQPDQVAPAAAPGVQHRPHAVEAPAQQLVEQVDVDVAERLAQRGGGWLKGMIHHGDRRIQPSTAAPAVAPAPKETRRMGRPSSARPARRASSSAMGTVAAPVLPKRPMLT